MVVVLTATTKLGLFDREGDLGKTFDNHDVNFTQAIRTRLEGLVTAHTSSTQQEDENVLAGKITTIQASAELVLSPIRKAAIGRMIHMVDDDEGLDKLNLSDALQVLDRQMRENTEGLKHNTATFAVAAQTGNTGNGQIIVSLIDKRGNPLKFVRTEVLKLECTQDAQPDGGSKLGGEIFVIRGEQSFPYWHEDWPGGSDARGSIISSAGEIEAGRAPGENLLVGGGFEVTTASNTFGQWDAVAGGFGSDIRETSTALVGSKALEFRGDASTLIHLRQKTANGADGTPVALEPMTHYSIGFWIRHDGTSPAAGVLDVKITSSTGGQMSVTPDHGSAVDAKISVTLSATTAVDSTYQYKSIHFVTPALVPTNPEFRIILTTALTSGRGVFMDGFVLQKMTRSYVGGPWLSAQRGATAWVRGDRMNVTVTNNNSNSNLIFVMDRMLGIRESGQTLATLSTETVADSVLA